MRSGYDNKRGELRGRRYSLEMKDFFDMGGQFTFLFGRIQGYSESMFDFARYFWECTGN